MRALFLVLAITGCTTHHRFTVGPTYAASKPDERTPQPGDPVTSPPSDLGVDAAGELTSGDDNLRLVLAGAARVGPGITGGGFRGGDTFGSTPQPFGVRGTVTLGPTFTGDGTLLDLRAGLGADYGLKAGATIGGELFISSIGTGDDHVVMIGIGISVGAFHHSEGMSIAASRPVED